MLPPMAGFSSVRPVRGRDRSTGASGMRGDEAAGPGGSNTRRLGPASRSAVAIRYDPLSRSAVGIRYADDPLSRSAVGIRYDPLSRSAVGMRYGDEPERVVSLV